MEYNIMFRFAFILLSLVSLCRGFTTTSTPHFSVRVALSSFADYISDDDDLRYRQMISKARECAYSDSGSAVDARIFLRDILHLESGCVSGNLSGEICDNIDEVADLVAHLRVKADNAVDKAVVHGATVGFMSMAMLTMFAAVILSTIDYGTGSTPYTLQEWTWAAQGGYLGNMLEHFLRNGGL